MAGPIDWSEGCTSAAPGHYEYRGHVIQKITYKKFPDRPSSGTSVLWVVSDPQDTGWARQVRTFTEGKALVNEGFRP